MYKSFVSLGRYIPKYFIFFVAMVNGIVFLNFFLFSLEYILNVVILCIILMHISHFMFFANDLSLAVYLYLF